MGARWRHLVNDRAEANNTDTFRQALPTAGALHGLLLRANATNGATGGRAVTMMDVVDEIRVRGEGEEPILTLHPTEVEKWFETLFKASPPMVQTEIASGVQEYVYPLYFGRSLYDREYFLPLDRFKNVDVELDFSPAIAADGGFATGSVTLDLMALITPHKEVLPYRGTLSTRRIREFTSVAAGEETVPMPDNALLRAVGVYAYEEAVADGVDLTRVRFEDEPEAKPYLDADWEDFINLNYAQFGCKIAHEWRIFAQNDDLLLTRIGEILWFDVIPFETSDVTADTFLISTFDAITGDQLTLDASIADVTAGAETHIARAADDDYYVRVGGKSPTYFGLWPHMYPDEEGGYLDVKKEGGVNCVLTQGGAGATVRVSIQELKKY
jgi:hypothetical protein